MQIGEATGEDFFRRSGGGIQQPALGGDAEDAGGESGAVREVMGGEEEGGAGLCGDPAEGLQYVASAFDIQECSGLIQQNQSGRCWRRVLAWACGIGKRGGLIFGHHPDEGGGDAAFLEFAVAERGDVMGCQVADSQHVHGMADGLLRLVMQPSVPAAFLVTGEPDEFGI